jgi:recombinational DNA repair protein (RecF pathway)
MSANRRPSTIRFAWSRLATAAVAPEMSEQCDGCRRRFSLRQVELIGHEILCADCAPSQFHAPLHPHLPAHPPLPGRARFV